MLFHYKKKLSNISTAYESFYNYKTMYTASEFFYFLIVKWASKKCILSYRNWLACSYAWKRFMVHLPSYHQGRVKKVSYLYCKIYIAKGMFQNTLRNKIWSRTSCDMYLNSRPVKGLSRPLFPNRKQIPSRRKYFILGLVIIHIDWAHDT